MEISHIFTMKSRVLLAQVHLLLSEIFQFLYFIVTVLSVKHKIKALLFRVLIYGSCESSFDMTAYQALVQSQFSKKNQPINELVYVIRMPAHSSGSLFLFFFLSQHVRDQKINQSRIIK